MRDETLRRAVHAFTATCFLAYYALPPVIYGWWKWHLLVVLSASITVVEVGRAFLGVRLILMRDYEVRRIAAYCWAMWGVLPVLLWLPPIYGAPVILTMAIVDPIMGILRGAGKNPTLTGFALSTAIYGVFLFVSDGYAGVLIAGVTSAAFVASEGPRWKRVDDDFLTLFMPFLVLYTAQLLI